MTRQEAKTWIDGSKRIFAIEFRKRTDNSLRLMNCRRKCLSALKNGAAAYDPDERGLITVFDMKKGYRSVPIEGIIRLKINGVWHEVADAPDTRR